MKIECQTDNASKKRVYCLEGELDVHQVKILKNHLLDDLKNAPEDAYVLNLAKVGYLDSSGLGMLVYLKKEIGRNGGSFSLTNLNEQVRNVFRLTKLEDFFGL
jgi:anti-sigma B factor antagonist